MRRALYLLFNEGYHGASAESAVRSELCAEAMRLTALLLEHPPSAVPETSALAALISLHAARLPARLDSAGDLSSLLDQDRSRWDARFVAQGLSLLERSAAGHELTAYHVEVAIAAAHAGASSVDETDWPSIVSLYVRLMTIAPSPVVALNRAKPGRAAASREAGARVRECVRIGTLKANPLSGQNLEPPAYRTGDLSAAVVDGRTYASTAWRRRIPAESIALPSAVIRPPRRGLSADDFDPCLQSIPLIHISCRC